MGRWRWNKKTTVEECLKLDIPWLCQHGYLQGYKRGGIEWRRGEEVADSIGLEVATDMATASDAPVVRLFYTQRNRETGEGESLDYSVRLSTTSCHFGGRRYWFVCPLVKGGQACGRRVGTLYLPPGGKYFGCRHCYELTYQSAQQHDSRVDGLAKLPPEMLMRLAESAPLRTRLTVLKAAMKQVDRRRKGLLKFV